MRRLAFAAVVTLAGVSLVAGALVGFGGVSAGGAAGATLVGLMLLVAIVWVLRRLLDRETPDGQHRRYPGEPGGLDPERTPDDLPMSGAYFTRTIETAIQRTEHTSDIDEGLDVVRPSLRATLRELLIEAGHTEQEAQQRMARGDWTDEQIAAAVVHPAVELPTLSLRERVAMWLFPERFVTAFTRATIEEIGQTADEVLPTIPGQNAPRPVPTAPPTIEQLRQGAGGELVDAADPFESAGEAYSEERTDGRAVHEAMGIVEEDER